MQRQRPPGTIAFMPASWLEFAAGNRGLVAYTREIPNPDAQFRFSDNPQRLGAIANERHNLL